MTTRRRRRAAMVPLIGLALAAAAAPAGAQEILSDPAGSRIAIEGDVSVRGVTPLPIDNLPPGTYTIEAWHEMYGTQTQEVTVGASESAEITFTFGEPAA